MIKEEILELINLLTKIQNEDDADEFIDVDEIGNLIYDIKIYLDFLGDDSNE